MPAGLAYLASNRRWQLAKHLVVLNNKLMDVAAGRCLRLMVCMPPRHGKSEFIDKYFCPWYLGTFPDRRIILASYEANFAADWGRKARDVLTGWGPQIFGIRVSDASSAANRWDLAGHLGGMHTAGVGGPITGKGANVLIIDDPVKNAEEASSKTIRERAWEWYRSTAYTRLEPGGAVILIMTRWNEDDLAGRILQSQEFGGQPWEVVNFPAIAEEKTVLSDWVRQPGEALWPARYPIEVLEEIKQTLGSYWWSALYQQRPQPEGGLIFKRSWIRYYHDDGDYYVLHRPEGDIRTAKDRCWIFQTCDPAATEKEKSDYFVLGTWVVTPDRDLLLVDLVREKAETTKHKQMLRGAYDRWHPSFQGVENQSFGLNIIQECKLEGLPIKPCKADQDKVSRARPMAARYEIGAVYHKAGAPWLGDFEGELVAFPNAAHDDCVDVASYAGIELALAGRTTPIVTAETASYEDILNSRWEGW